MTVRGRFEGLRYVLVGLFNTGLDIGLFTTLVVLVHVAPIYANVASTVAVMSVSYLINRTWVFGSERRGIASYLRFVSVTLFSGLLVQSAIIHLVLAAIETWVPSIGLGLAAPAAKVIAVGVGMVINFLGYRWLFAHQPEHPVQAGPESPASQ